MKILNLISIVLFFNFSYGQVYEFDKIIKNKISTKNFPNQERTNLFNSLDHSYHMQVYRQNDSLKSRIFDTKTNEIHLFYINKTDSTYFQYHQTINFQNTLKNQPYEFSGVEVMEDKNILKLTILNHKKRKIARYKLTIENNEHDLFSLFKLSGALHPYEFSNILPPQNFKVIKSEGINESGNHVTYELISIEDIKISISLP